MKIPYVSRNHLIHISRKAESEMTYLARLIFISETKIKSGSVNGQRRRLAVRLPYISTC